ncbi:MAG: hypothetical protein D4R63_05255 [Methylococcaceae bacterium]|nr:MAG: hypothetical protein D4R63_05255 [Methylococcaceae bacterium]
MNYLPLLLSIPIGIFLAEFSFRFFLGTWFNARLIKMANLLPTFLSTEGDDARQALMLSSGLMTMTFGFIMLAILIALSTIAYYPAWQFGWGTTDSSSYFISLSIVAVLWVIFRRMFKGSQKHAG